MKKFNIQNQAIIMCGISGSGKTDYAKKLEDQGYLRLSTDALIWNKTGSQLSLLSKEKQKRLFRESREEVRKQLILHLESGEKLVVDATHCKRKVRDDIRDICSGFGIKPVFIYCYADKDELWRRLSERKGTGPDDLKVTEEEFNDYWLGFERPEEDETDFIFYKTDKKEV